MIERIGKNGRGGGMNSSSEGRSLSLPFGWGLSCLLKKELLAGWCWSRVSERLTEYLRERKALAPWRPDLPLESLRGPMGPKLFLSMMGGGSTWGLGWEIGWR